MIHRFFALFSLAFLAAAPLRATAQGRAATPPGLAVTAPSEASQFAFLVGQWTVTVTPKATTLATRIHGVPKFTGIWKAWRALDGFGIEDELRIVDASGNPNSLTHTVRLYDATTRRWTQTSVDVYRGRMTPSTGTWADGAMELRSEGRDAEGTPYVQRTRIFDITPTSFNYQADRSTDGGKTWTVGVLKMTARRVAANAPR